MRELDVLEKLIVRCWSHVVSSDLMGLPSQVTEELRIRGTVMTMDDVAKRMTAPRVIGALPVSAAVAS